MLFTSVHLTLKSKKIASTLVSRKQDCNRLTTYIHGRFSINYSARSDFIYSIGRLRASSIFICAHN